MINWRLERTDARLLQGLVVAFAVVYPMVAMLPTVEGWLRTKAGSLVWAIAVGPADAVELA